MAERNPTKTQPQEAADKFLEGDLKDPEKDSYNGYGYGSSSLQAVTPESKRAPIKDKEE